MKKRVTKCVDNPLNLFFEFLKNHHGNTIYQKKSFNFFNNFLYFQSCNKKKFMKIHHVLIILYIFKTFKKNMWIGDFLFQKSLVLIKCSPICFNLFVNFNIFHNKGSIVQNIQKYIYPFKFWYSNILKHCKSFLFVMVQSKVIHLIIM